MSNRSKAGELLLAGLLSRLSDIARQVDVFRITVWTALQKEIDSSGMEVIKLAVEDRKNESHGLGVLKDFLRTLPSGDLEEIVLNATQGTSLDSVEPVVEASPPEISKAKRTRRRKILSQKVKVPDTPEVAPKGALRFSDLIPVVVGIVKTFKEPFNTSDVATVLRKKGVVFQGDHVSVILSTYLRGLKKTKEKNVRLGRLVNTYTITGRVYARRRAVKKKK